ELGTRIDECQHRRMSKSEVVALPVPQGGDGVPCCPPLTSGELSQADAEKMAVMFKALSDPVRLRLCANIASHPGGEACVCDIADVGVSQPTVSHHLKKLREAGLLTSERRGTWVYYRIAASVVAAMAAMLDLRGCRVGTWAGARRGSGSGCPAEVPGAAVCLAPHRGLSAHEQEARPPPYGPEPDAVAARRPGTRLQGGRGDRRADRSGARPSAGPRTGRAARPVAGSSPASVDGAGAGRQLDVGGRARPVARPVQGGRCPRRRRSGGGRTRRAGRRGRLGGAAPAADPGGAG